MMNAKAAAGLALVCFDDNGCTYHEPEYIGMGAQQVDNDSLADGLQPEVLNINLYALALNAIISEVGNKNTSQDGDYS